MCVPETEREQLQIESRYHQNFAKRIATEAAPYRPQLEKLLEGCLDGSEESITVGCAALLGKDLARRAWPELFDEADKDGLVRMHFLKARSPGVYEKDGLLFFAHSFLRRSLSRLNTLNTPFLSRLESMVGDGSLDVRVALDPDLIGLASTYRDSLEHEFWWGPKFSDQILQMDLGVTRHATSERQRLINGISQTDFWWYEQSGNRTFECEELRDIPTLGVSDERFGCRFVHSILDPKTGTPVHTDGAIRMYQFEAMLKRLDVDLKNSGRHTEYTKLWRVDGLVPVEKWKRLISDYFRDNSLVGEYFGGVDEAAPSQLVSDETDDDPSPSILTFVPSEMSAEDGVQISVSYHHKAPESSEDRFVVTFDSLSAGSDKFDYIDSNTIEIVKLLRQQDRPIELPADAFQVAFEDLVSNFPVIGHSGKDSVALANQTQRAFEVVCETSIKRGLNRLVSFTLGIDYEDRTCFFSLAGHVQALDRWLKRPESILPSSVDEVREWVSTAFYALGREFGRESDGPPLWSVLQNSGVLRFERRLLRPDEFELRCERGNPEILLNVRENDLAAIKELGIRPAPIWKIKRSDCGKCSQDYMRCGCSKMLDANVVQNITDADLVGFFWTNRPA